MSFYRGKKGDKFCGLCGSKTKTVRRYSGIFNTKTGKKDIDVLIICTNQGCFGVAPKDLMLVESKQR